MALVVAVDVDLDVVHVGAVSGVGVGANRGVSFVVGGKLGDTVLPVSFPHRVEMPIPLDLVLTQLLEVGVVAGLGGGYPLLGVVDQHFLDEVCTLPGHMGENGLHLLFLVFSGLGEVEVDMAGLGLPLLEESLGRCA